MAKGLRSKVKRRFRTLKRKHVDNVHSKQQFEAINTKLQQLIKGQVTLEQTPPNYFKHPNNPNAIVPQYKMPNMLDLRSSNIPIAGKEFVGAYRKKIVHEEEEKQKKQNAKMVDEEQKPNKKQHQKKKQTEQQQQMMEQIDDTEQEIEDDKNGDDGVIEFTENDLLDFNKMSLGQIKKKIDKQIKQNLSVDATKSKKISKKRKNVKDKVACKKSRLNIRSFGRKKI